MERQRNDFQDLFSAHCYAGPGDVECDVCIGRKRKALYSCLVCQVSYCEAHLQPHYQSPAFNWHTLVKARVKLQNNICFQHNKLMESYCRTDQSFICYLCMMEKHKDPDTVSAENIPKNEEMNPHQRILEKQMKVQEIKQTEDTIKSFSSLCVSPGCDVSPSFTVQQHLSFDGVTKPLSDLKIRDEENCGEELNKIPPQAFQMFLPSEPKSRRDLLQYFCSLTLDPNTAHPELILSEMNKAVTCMNSVQRYSLYPERFNSWRQVLCKESVCGRCYWEVEWSGWVSISVSYKEISRNGEGKGRGVGFNSQSWSLVCSTSSVSFWYNNIKTELQGPVTSRIGVYVDHSAGTLSFYSVSDTMRLLHSVHTTFTQPLYAGVYIWDFNSTVRFCDPE